MIHDLEGELTESKLAIHARICDATFTPVKNVVSDDKFKSHLDNYI